MVFLQQVVEACYLAVGAAVKVEQLVFGQWPVSLALLQSLVGRTRGSTCESARATFWLLQSISGWVLRKLKSALAPASTRVDRGHELSVTSVLQIFENLQVEMVCLPSSKLTSSIVSVEI